MSANTEKLIEEALGKLRDLERESSWTEFTLMRLAVLRSLVDSVRRETLEEACRVQCPRCAAGMPLLSEGLHDDGRALFGCYCPKASSLLSESTEGTKG